MFSALIARSGFDLHEFLLLAIVVLAAAILRGFAGFGFGAIFLGAGALFVAPAVLVPVSLSLEIFATAHMLPNIWRSVNWQVVLWMTVGSLLTVVFAQHLLAGLDVTVSQLVTGVLILGAVALLIRGFSIATEQRKIALFAGGLFSGVLNGLAAVGGIVCTLLTMSIGEVPATIRATTAMFLLIANIAAISASVATDSGLFNANVAWTVALLTPVLLVGVYIGSRQFAATSPALWRRIAIFSIITLSMLVVLSALWRLFS